MLWSVFISNPEKAFNFTETARCNSLAPIGQWGIGKQQPLFPSGVKRIKTKNIWHTFLIQLPNEIHRATCPWPSSFVFQGCHKRVPQTGWLKQQQCIVLHSGGQTSRGRQDWLLLRPVHASLLTSGGLQPTSGIPRLLRTSSTSLLHSLTVFSQCPSRFSLSTCLALCPNFCFLLGRRSYWITAYPNDLIFKNNLITSVEILFPKRSHSEALHVRISINLLGGGGGGRQLNHGTEFIFSSVCSTHLSGFSWFCGCRLEEIVPASLAARQGHVIPLQSVPWEGNDLCTSRVIAFKKENACAPFSLYSSLQDSEKYATWTAPQTSSVQKNYNATLSSFWEPYLKNKKEEVT